MPLTDVRPQGSRIGQRSRRTPDGLGAGLADLAHPMRAALDSLNTNCIMADLDLTLVYANRQAEATLKLVAPAIRAAFGVDLNALLGGSIHRFHKDPSRIERILADPGALPRTAVFSFGGITLRTLINAVTDHQGTRIGYVVIWDDVTARNASADTVFTTVETATERVNTLSTHISQASSDTSAQAEAMAAATEQMRASVQEIARSSSEVAAQVAQAVDATREGVSQLNALQRASTEIGDFLRLITNVAEQTKLLALNATIEAARAGTAGRGFAVVADEVKQLAGTTSASIGDIEQRVQAIQAAAVDGVRALASIDTLVEQISQSQATVAAAIEEQSATTSEIAHSITTIAGGIRDTADQAGEVVQAIATIHAPVTSLHQMIQNS